MWKHGKFIRELRVSSDYPWRTDEKALGVQDTIADYQSQLLDLATEKLDNIEQYFENRTEYNDNFGYLTPITDLQKALDTFTKELDKQVNDGVIKSLTVPKPPM